ncbi:CSC1-like protein ERD4 [Hondaea fermentalgiana]|uniref:CSC1-like protein ERD4 n=1 Tax=Hondaea fermentalgiana TaxID=2315210 RepID=A0A2R5GE12_9STRA|nr:CSC1-like protein ERD4 [Hondaea fermentalgiana]|eukprot:GBG28569.1 CSC1-like protein ERD4 [Hondaea fermentalgiana]
MSEDAGPTQGPTPAVKPDIAVDTFLSTCASASLGFVVLFAFFAVVRAGAARGGWARKIFAPRLLTARIPPRAPPRGIWKWLRSMSKSEASRRILDEVGLDAFMMNRLLVLCSKTFLWMTPCCLFVLLPLYATEPTNEAVGFKRYTIDSLLKSREADGRLWAAVVMTYVNSIIVLYFLHQEYRQYIRHRHEFLRRLSPQSYTVLVERIPKALCNRPALLHYFRKIFGNRVLDARVVESDPMLNYALRKRLEAVTLLERALYELDRTGKRPWRLYFPWMCGQIRQRMAPLGVFHGDYENIHIAEAGLEEHLLQNDSGASRASTPRAGAQTGEEPQADSSEEDDDDDDDDDEDEDEDDDGEMDGVIEPRSSDLSRSVSQRSPANSSEPGTPQVLTSSPVSPVSSTPPASAAAASTGQDNNAEGELTIPGSTSGANEDALGGLNSAPSTIPNVSVQDSVDEERIYLESWQRELQAGGYSAEQSGAQVNPEAFHGASSHARVVGHAAARHHSLSQGHHHRGQRRSYCLWLMAHFNVYMYIDSIKSYKRELKVWNRRVKRLQFRAMRRRQRIEEEAIANVVIPSQQVVQDQFRLRLKQERKLRRANHQRRHSASGTGELRRRTTGDSLAGDNASMPGGAAMARGYGAGQGASTMRAAENYEPRRRRSLEQRPGAAGDIETATRSSSGKSLNSASASATPLAVPWDDGNNALLRSLLTERKISESGMSVATSDGDEDSEYFLDDDDGLSGYATSDDGQVNLFEHAGLDDILRYAVDQNERTSAFITFSSLTAAMAAAQSTIDRPLKMSISVAPDVRDVLWENLGLPLPLLAFFTWVIRAILAAVVIVFGTITASLAALTNLAYLQKVIPGLREWLIIHGQWVVLFQQLTPMMMVVLYTLVPPIINTVLSVQRRRFMSETQIEFFQVYYYFLLIQVFLFYTVAGGFLQNFSSIVVRPIEFLSLMGRALPSNELFFLQYFVTRTFLLIFELLRVADVSIAVIRGMFTRSRTARDRRTPWCGCTTIDHPTGGNIERTISNITLCFSIGLCYSVICPPMTFVALVFFLVATVVYRNQLLFVYTHEREGGGLMFPYVFRALIISVVIFQLVMLGIFSVRASPTSVSLMIPLVVLTLSFMLFCENAYERPSRFLPLGDASELDIIHGKPKIVLEFQHPALKAPAKLLPESSDADSYRLMRHASLTAWGDTAPSLNDSFSF